MFEYTLRLHCWANKNIRISTQKFEKRKEY